jgi:hypothetical protein
MRLTDTLQDGETMPDFLVQIKEMIDPQTRTKDIHNGITLQAVFAQFQDLISSGNVDDETVLSDHIRAFNHYVQGQTYEAKLNTLVDNWANNPDSAEARSAVFAQLDQIREYADFVARFGATVSRLNATSILATLAATPSEPVSQHREEWRQFVHSLVVNQLKPMIASIFSNLRETLVDGEGPDEEVIPLIKPYEDVSAGFGKAIMRGSEKFAASFRGIGGAFSAFSGGGLSLKNAMKEVAKDAGRQAHRETYVTTNYGNYAAEHGLYDAEVAQIEKSMQDFRFVPDLVKTFAKPDWYTKQANRLAVVQSLKFNISNIMADLTRAGFAERVADEVKRKEFIELAMTHLIAPHPEWYHALERVDAVGIDQIAGDDVDVKNALLFLKSVASNPPDDQLTAAEEHEIDEQFSIF